MTITHKKSLLSACLVIATFTMANAGYTQSMGAGTASDTDYLSALDGMVADMDLDGLAGQTFDPTSVAAPHLPVIASGEAIAACDTLLAQAAASGHPIEIFGADNALSNDEVAALSKCLMPDTGVVVSYLMPAS